MKHALNLGKAEMDILRYVAENAPVTVRDAARHLEETKGHVRTTVLNTMERLRAKKFLGRKKINGVYHYHPVKSKSELFAGLLKGFIDSAFGGSRAPLVAYFAEQDKITRSELRMLKNIAERLDRPGK